MNTVFGTYGEYCLAAIALLLLVGPITYHLLGGWVSKREEVFGSFLRPQIKSYFLLFFPAKLTDGGNSEQDFQNLYDARFGRKHFIIPGLLFIVVSGFLLFFASWTVFLWLRRESDAALEMPAVAVAAFVGGYVWVLYDLCTRAHQRDLRPPNLFWSSFRLLAAAPLGYGIALMFKENVGVPVAILLGAFPTQTLLTIARRLVVSQFKHSDLLDESGRELEELQGIGRSQAERFMAEGVATIVQLAYSDPIDLTIRTNFSFSYVVDCCSQALAWLYFHGDLAKMRKLGLRGAQEIAVLIAELDGTEQAEGISEADSVRLAKQCVTVAANELKMDHSALEWVLRQVAEDPYTKFLWEVWCADSFDDD